MEDRKYKLLERLQAHLKEGDYIEETALTRPEESGGPMAMLQASVLDYGPYLVDILCEYAFLPIEDRREDVWYFCVMITVSDTTPADRAAELSEAVARLNYYLPYGAFCVSKDGASLLYKHTIPCRVDADDDTLAAEICLAADIAMATPESYTGPLLEVAHAGATAEQFISSLAG